MKDLTKQLKDKELYNEPTHQEIIDRNNSIIDELLVDGKVIKCVIPVSGGKDSQCCMKLAIKEFGAENIIGMFCDTRFEHPLTYQHVEDMKNIYGVRIITLNEGDVYSKIIKHGRFPSDIARFCTDQLKIQVGKKFYKQLAERQGCGFEVWYEVR